MFPSLKAEMARYGIKTKDIIQLLGISDKTAQHKLSGKSHFTSVEMKKIRDRFFPGMTIDYLFYDDSVHKGRVS
jgi:hypothetical protein